MSRGSLLVVLVGLMACGSPKPGPATPSNVVPGGNGPAPVAVDDDTVVDEGGGAFVTVVDNDEGDLDPTTVTIVDPPGSGSADVGSDGGVTYTHDGSEGTDDSFTYTVAGTNGAVSNVATVEITVTPTDDPLVALEDAITVDEGGSVLIFVTTNDDDPDDGLDLASIRVAGDPLHGRATALGDGTIEYEHDGTEGPTDAFSYGVRNTPGTEAIPSVAVNITVNPVDDAPTARDDAAAAVDGALISIDLAGNDVDPEGLLDVTSIVVMSQPQHGTVAVAGDGTVDYQHDGLGELLDSFTYQISDLGGLTSNTATVILADTACATHPQWMPVTCQTPDWVWSRDRFLAQDVPTAEALQLLATGCNHSGYNQPDMGNGLCSLTGTGWVSVDQFAMTGCDTEWYHLGGSFTGNCGGHDTAAPVDFYRHLVMDPLGCYSY